MPTYEYVCKACGNQWEAEQRISEDPLKDCPKCGKPEASRQISGGNFILKGGGWYADLYSSSKPSSGSKSEGSSSSSSSETKSESKSEAKTETKAASTPPKSST